MQSRVATVAAMMLTQQTDFGLRALLYLARAPEAAHSATDMAAALRVSVHTLRKALGLLRDAGLIVGERGRTGGVRLAKPPAAVNLGHVVQVLEPGLRPVSCFAGESDCPFVGDCALVGELRAATDAFIARLGQSTLADVMGAPQGLVQLAPPA